MKHTSCAYDQTIVRVQERFYAQIVSLKAVG